MSGAQQPDPERGVSLRWRGYDGAGQRVQQVATSSGATTTTSYIGSLEEVATTGTTTTTTAYYGGLAERVNGTLSYLLSDGLGSVSEAVSTASGSVSATQLYGPYGAVRYQSGTLPTDKGYTGQRADTSRASVKGLRRAAEGRVWRGRRGWLWYNPARGVRRGQRRWHAACERCTGCHQTMPEE